MINLSSRVFVFTYLILSSSASFCATRMDKHLPISHCYHWLDEKNSNFLTYKYQYGDINNGDVAFVAGRNGAIAGPGLYCAKSPSGSTSYGDRVIRLDLVDDIVMYDATTGKKYCGHNGNFYPQNECDRKQWDIKFYSGGGIGNKAWYVIKAPQAIARWSANSDQLVSDLQLSKTVNSGGISAHFDQTLRYIQRERSQDGGPKTYINGNARMSILDILEKPNLLRQIPAMTVISKVSIIPKKDFSDRKKKKVFKTQLERALADSFLSYDDINSVVKTDTLVEKVFTDLLTNITTEQLKKFNIPVVLLGLNEYTSLTESKAIGIWNYGIFSAGPFKLIIDNDIQPSSPIGNGFAQAIVSNRNKLDKIQDHNYISLITLLDRFANKNKNSVYYKQITQEILMSSIVNNQDPIKMIKELKNPLLQKAGAISNILKKLYSTKFDGLDPIVVGHLVDISNIDKQTYDKYSQKIDQLEIPVTKRATYFLSDDYRNGDITLPSMVSNFSYVTKLFNRALSERGKKGMTNTYRFLFSDIFHLYFSKIKKEDDNTKKQQLVKVAADFMYQFANSLSSDLFKSYGYILTQNASFFDMDMKYDDHPIQGAFDYYLSGDSNFDTFFLDITKYSLEGSYAHFLIDKAEEGDTKALDLLKIILTYFNSSEFDSWIKSDEFKLSQKEKEDWKNVIERKKYSRGGKFVSSDLCRFSKVLYRKRRDIKKIVDVATFDAMMTKNTSVYKSDICK